jgi:soluble lytic murein transglycosylase-like protein
MDQAYWLGRERDAIANARAANFADVQLIHYGLAHRYSIEAVKAAKAAKRKRARQLKMNLSEQLTTAFPPIPTPAA